MLNQIKCLCGFHTYLPLPTNFNKLSDKLPIRDNDLIEYLSMSVDRCYFCHQIRITPRVRVLSLKPEFVKKEDDPITELVNKIDKVESL